VGSILLVESDSDTSDQWAAAVNAAGHSALTATTTRDALESIREGGIDVVVIDTYDPRAGVIELARNMAALPDAPPIILISSSPDAPEISARIGAAAFLPKPCETSEIIAAVNRLLGVLRPVLVVEDEPTGPTGPDRPFG
jgi:DNA-binding NtrC family response regulator